MNILDALKQGIDTTIKYSNELLKNKDFDRITKMFDKFILAVSSKNSNRLLNYSIFEYFSMFVIARNYDDENFKIDNIIEELEKYRGLINSWQSNKPYFFNLAKTVDALEHDHDFYTTPKYNEMLQSLGFDSSINKYNIVSALKATELFIEFRVLYKEQTDDFQSKVITKQLFERMDYVAEFCRNLRNDIQDNKKEYIAFYQNRIKYTKELKESIDNKSIPQIIEVSDEWYDYLHPTVLALVYPIINVNLETYYKYVNETIESIEKTTNNNPLIQFMFSEHIDSDIIPKEIHDSLNDTNIETIKTNYTLLKYLGINPYEIFIKYSELLKTIDNESATKLTYLAEKNILNKDTITKNPSILLNNINTIASNYELLKDTIDFSNINYNGDILFINPDETKRRLNILSQYQLIKSNYIFLLCNFDYIGIYDLIIENEIPEHLFISICYTASPLDTIKRIKLYKELSIPYLSPTYTLLSEVSNPQKASCSKEDLDAFYPDTINSYLYKNVPGTNITDIIDDEIIKTLDKEYRIDNVYLISSKPISRPKVLRNLQFIKDNNCNPKEYLLTSLISNSIISDDEISELKQLIQEKNYILL